MRVLEVMGEKLEVKVSPTWLDKAVCPAALKFQYIDKRKRDYSVAAERGSAAHEAISDLTNICLDRSCQPKDLSDDVVSKIVDDKTDHRLFEEVQNILQWVQKWRDRYRLSKYMVGHEERMAIDTNFDEVDWNVADYRGIVDVIDIHGTHCVVTDYKSQPHVVSQTELDNHFQLTFYTWLVSKFYPFVKTFEVRLWYLRYGFYATTPRTMDQIAEFEEGLMLKVKKVMSIDSWDPIPGTYCKWCDHTGVCPIGRPDKNGNYSPIPEAIITDKQAKFYASELRVLEERRKKLSDAVRNYVKGQEEPVDLGNGFAYGYIPSESMFFAPDKVMSVLRDHGVDPSAYATFSATTMKKLLKITERDQPSLYQDLEDIVNIRAKTRFGGFDT